MIGKEKIMKGQKESQTEQKWTHEKELQEPRSETRVMNKVLKCE